MLRGGIADKDQTYSSMARLLWGRLVIVQADVVWLQSREAERPGVFGVFVVPRGSVGVLAMFAACVCPCCPGHGWWRCPAGKAAPKPAERLVPQGAAKAQAIIAAALQEAEAEAAAKRLAEPQQAAHEEDIHDDADDAAEQEASPEPAGECPRPALVTDPARLMCGWCLQLLLGDS